MLQSATYLFFQYFSVFLLTIIALWGIGESVFRLLGIRSGFSYTAIIRNSFIGYILVIAFYAIIKTHGITINVVFIFLLGCGVWELFRNKNLIKKLIETNKEVANPFLLLLMALAVFTWAWISIYNSESALQFNYFADNILYSKISRSIATSGYENGFYFLNDFDSYYHGPEPYHYFDLWGGSLVASMLNLNHYLTLQLSIYPIFYFLFLTSLLTFVEGKKKIIHIAICFLLLFLTGMYADFYHRQPFLSLLQNFSFHVLTPWYNKLSYFYIFFVCSYQLYVNQLKGIAILCLLGLTIANIVALPVLVAGLLLVIVCEFFTMQETRKEGMLKAFYIFGTTFSVVLFYAVFKRESSGLAGVEITAPIKLLINSLMNMGFDTQRNILAGGMLHLILFYLPLFPLLYLFVKLTPADKRPSNKHYGRLIVATIGIGLLGWAFLYREVNSLEVFTVSTVPMMNTAFAVIAVLLINHASLLWRERRAMFIFSTLVVTSLSVIHIIYALPDETIKKSSLFTNNYLNKIHFEIESRKLKSGASIKDATLLKGHHSKFNAVYPLGEYVTLMDESVSIINIGDFNTPIDSSSVMNVERSIKAISSAVFYRYVKNRVNEEITPAIVEDMQLAFINQYKIQFLVLSRFAQIPEKIKDRIDKVITDKVTGERFLILK